MISLPKINGAVGIVLKGLIAMATGPAKIDAVRADVQGLKIQVDALGGDVRELSGYIKGHVQSQQHDPGG